jgi:ABC-type amino acid transport substrate-binding protein
LLAVLATWFVWFHAQEASADTLDDVLARGELRWGGDQEGGGPFVYPREDGSGEVTGFEVELAAAVARELGVAARFEQGNWDKLPDLLRIGKIDVVLNGYELTPERAAELAASRAYYVYPRATDRPQAKARRPPRLRRGDPRAQEVRRRARDRDLRR